MARKKRFSGEADLKPWLTNKAPGSKTNGRFIQVGNSLLMNTQFQELSTGAKYLYLCMAMEAGSKMISHFQRGSLRGNTESPPLLLNATGESWRARALFVSWTVYLSLSQKRNLPRIAFASASRSGATGRLPAISLRDIHR